MGSSHLTTESISQRLSAVLACENDFEGVLPAGLGRARHLNTVSMSGTRLEGSLPPFCSKQSQLRHLSLRGLQLDGTVPRSLSRMSSGYIGHVLVLGHGLTGEVPKVGGTILLLSLYGNDFEGHLRGAGRRDVCPTFLR
eukprot:6113769-Amphidinium_carterae.1